MAHVLTPHLHPEHLSMCIDVCRNPTTFKSDGSSTWIPRALEKALIIFFFLRRLALIWKNFVFLSPAESHSILALCRHINSSLWYISTSWSFNLISRWDNLVRWGSLRRDSSSLFSHLISFRTLPNVLWLQLSKSSDKTESFLWMSSRRAPGCTAFQLVVILFCHVSCVSHIVS